MSPPESPVVQHNDLAGAIDGTVGSVCPVECLLLHSDWNNLSEHVLLLALKIFGSILSAAS